MVFGSSFSDNFRGCLTVRMEFERPETLIKGDRNKLHLLTKIMKKSAGDISASSFQFVLNPLAGKRRLKIITY